MVHLVDGGGYVLHPEDEERYAEENDDGGASDLLWFPIGTDCARKLGLAWTVELEPKHGARKG